MVSHMAPSNTAHSSIRRCQKKHTFLIIRVKCHNQYQSESHSSMCVSQMRSIALRPQGISIEYASHPHTHAHTLTTSWCHTAWNISGIIRKHDKRLDKNTQTSCWPSVSGFCVVSWCFEALSQDLSL